MINKLKSSAAKVVVASLLVASLLTPAFSGAASAAVVEGKTVSFQTLKTGMTEEQRGIKDHLVSEGIVTGKKGETKGHLTVLAKSAPMIAGMQTKQNGVFVDAAEVKHENGTITYSFRVVEGKALESKLHVVVPSANMDKWYEYDLVMGELPTEKASVKVYKDGTTEESTMKNYVEPNVSITNNGTKNFATMTIKKGQEKYIHDFHTAGKKATKAVKDGLTTYTFEVADTTKLVNAEIHVIVNEPALGVNYDEKHKVQFGFNSNPFKDIDKDGNKAAILALYNKGIVVGADKFNPTQDLTRSQFALMVARALDLTPTKSAGFQDIVNMSDKERLNAINALAEVGIVKTGKKFNPNNTLTRQQGALMLYRAVKYVTEEEMTFKDTSLPFYADRAIVTDPEAQEAFTFLYEAEIMTGSRAADGKVSINANSSLKRTQMAKILNGSLNLMEK